MHNALHRACRRYGFGAGGLFLLQVGERRLVVISFDKRTAAC
jgi:hypothetical protein